MRRERHVAGWHSSGAPACRSCGLLTALAISIVATLALNLVVATQAPAAQAAASQLYFGFVYPEAPDITALNTYENQIGKGVSLVLWYQPWEESGVPQPFPTDQMTAIRQHGSIPVLAWEPFSYLSPQLDRDFSLGAIASGKWDSFLREFANAAKAWGHPFFLRFASEMNGAWALWSEQANGNTAGQFVQAWRHIHDIFTSVGATNVTWVWCPNAEGYGTTPLQELYPGDAYVDWAGMDGYNFGTDFAGGPWRPFTNVFSATYADLLHVLPKTMPIMIGETGSVEDGGSKPDWIRDTFTVQLPSQFPRIKALLWFNIAKGGLDTRVDTTPQSLAAFRSAIALSTYQPNLYADLSQTPIPVPEAVAWPHPVLGTPTPSQAASLAAVIPLPTLQTELGGPPPGSIQVVNATQGTAISGAHLTFTDGTTVLTDATGTAHLPPQVLTSVLVTITVGSVAIYTILTVDAHHGYQLQIEPASGRVTHVLVNIVELVIPTALQVSLLAVLGLYVTYRVARRRRRRMGMYPRR